MAIPTLNAVGFCAHYSRQGDWAFDYALRLSRNHQLKLNVFHFLTDPYAVDDSDRVEQLSPEARARLAIEREKELRLYYDQRAGDYLEVGFRLCDNPEWVELHRCLVVREFQLLVLGYVGPDAYFGGRPITRFADSFVCPVVLVGPDDPRQFHLNSQAQLIAASLDLEGAGWAATAAGSAEQ
ncbi:universal stress protein [candidate division GN15 bacterium]|nr:universal stress protein [candidate division GN15 bacterium]